MKSNCWKFQLGTCEVNLASMIKENKMNTFSTSPLLTYSPCLHELILFSSRYLFDFQAVSSWYLPDFKVLSTKILLFLDIKSRSQQGSVIVHFPLIHIFSEDQDHLQTLTSAYPLMQFCYWRVYNVFDCEQKTRQAWFCWKWCLLKVGKFWSLVSGFDGAEDSIYNAVIVGNFRPFICSTLRFLCIKE